MAKHLLKFKTEEEYQTALKNGLIKPCVCLIESTKKVYIHNKDN